MIECGFFDSVDRDRLYKAETMTRPYELLVSNGVFATQNGTPSNYLQVYAEGGMSVMVMPGRGIFKDKWLINDADLMLTVDAAEVTLTRIDSVIVKIDTSESVRAGTIEIKKGTPSSSPVAPTMTRSPEVHEYRLADIRIAPQSTAITQAMITDRRGSGDCPWVTSLIKQVDTSTLFVQFQDAFNSWFKDVKEKLSTSTLIRSFSSLYVTQTQDETVIPIDIDQFNSDIDILQVYINGLILVKDVEYTVQGYPTNTVTLKGGVDAGTSISFIVYKSVDGSEAESVIQYVEDLQDDVLALGNRVTTAEGDITTLEKNLATTNSNLATTNSNLNNEIATTNNEIGALNQVVAEIKAGNGFTGHIDVPGAVRVNGVQGVYSDANNTNVQLGSTSCDTVIHGENDIYLNVRANTRSLVPNATESYQIGNTSLRYNGIYLVNTPNVSSDRRLKQDIESIDPVGALTFIDQLDVVHYAYKSDPKTQRVGLIAQDVYDAGGDKYIEIDEDGMYSLKPMDLIYPLIASVQQLSRLNSDLQEEIDMLENRIKALEKKK